MDAPQPPAAESARPSSGPAAAPRGPAGLVAAGAVAALSLAAAGMVFYLYPEVSTLQLAVHCAAGLCLGWIALAHAIRYRRPALAASTAGRDLEAVLQMASIVLGLIAIIVMTYVAATEVLRRTPYLVDYRARWQIDVWRTGLFDLGLVAAAVLIGWAHGRDPQLPTVCFWTLALAGLWLSLQMPALRRVATETGGAYRDLSRWGIPFMFWLAALIAVFSILEAAARRRRNRFAGTARELLGPFSAWPGFRYSIGLLGAAVLILACIHVASVWATVSAFAAGGAILAMVARRWEENLADLGVGLISLGITSLPLLLVPSAGRLTSEWFANVFNAVVGGLAVTIAFWHWLAGVWDQQLDAGRPWTTAGRLIRSARRVGFLCGAIGVLVAMQLAFWPAFPVVQSLDSHAGRWACGLGAYALLIGGLTYAALATGKATLAWLALFAATALAVFTLIRLGDGPVPLWWNRHWPMAMAALAGLALGVAEAVRRHPMWQPFGEPLLLLGVLIGPTVAVAGASIGQILTLPPWVPAATFALLAGVYLLAARRPGPRAYVILSLLCAGLALLRLLQMKGATTL